MYLNKADLSELKVIAFSANDSVIRQKTFYGLPVVPFEHIERIYSCQEYHMFVAVGYSEMNRKRAKFFEEAKDKGYNMISYVHPSTIINDEFEVVQEA